MDDEPHRGGCRGLTTGGREVDAKIFANDAGVGGDPSGTCPTSGDDEEDTEVGNGMTETSAESGVVMTLLASSPDSSTDCRDGVVFPLSDVRSGVR